MHQLILCTCPDRITAESIARMLIASRLAACVNILPGLVSVYQWQDAVETAEEYFLLIKSRQERFPAIEKAIKDVHPYQLPEIIAVAIDSGSTEYLQWIDRCLRIE